MILSMAKMNRTRDLYDHLSAISKPEQSYISRKTVSVREKGVTYIADIDPEARSVVFGVDGKLISDSSDPSLKKCDKLILIEIPDPEKSCAGIFVELKGGDFSRAVRQLMATISHSLFSKENFAKRYARIVIKHANYPKKSPKTSLREAEIKFKKCRYDFKKLNNGEKDVIKHM